ncbi:hypothetical protein KEM54_001154, partial [Ascosphaera aggregata]
MCMSSPFKIAIVGSGPVGALLGRLLTKDLKTDRIVTIFESDSSPNSRNQGGSLDLGESTGIYAIKKARLWKEFIKYARYEADSGLLADHRLNIYLHKSGGNIKRYQRPEIDRVSLRQISVAALPER